METVKLAYFNVNRCGYYQFGDSAPVFGGLLEILRDVKSWIHGKKLRETKVFDPADENIFPVYISDLAINVTTGDAVVVTWNETPTTGSGQVAAAAGEDIVGSVDVSLMDVPEGGIPGFPSFFLFIPERSIVITIRFDGQTHSGKPGLSMYLNEFMTKFSSHVVLSETDDGAKIYGYASEPDQEPQQVRPVYKTVQARVPGEVEWLRDRCTQIRKLVRKDLLTTGAAPNYTQLKTIWSWLDIADPAPPSSGSVRFDFEIDCALTDKQFSELVDFDAVEHARGKDIGFRLVGEGGVVHWLSHCLVKQELDINIQRSDAGLVSANELLKKLSTSRGPILSIVPDA